MLIDFHSHYASELAACQLLNADTWQQAEQAITAQRFSLGLHPWRAHWYKLDAAFWQELERLAALPQVWAIGECGLDKYYEQQTSKEAQEAILCAHFELAARLQKPLILHTVGRYNETLRLLQQRAKGAPALALHGFASRASVALPFWKMGVYTSFGAALMQNVAAQNALQVCPAERFFLETDAQKRYDIQEIYEKAATLRAVELPQLQMQIEENWARFFGKSHNVLIDKSL